MAPELKRAAFVPDTSINKSEGKDAIPQFVSIINNGDLNPTTTGEVSRGCECYAPCYRTCYGHVGFEEAKQNS